MKHCSTFFLVLQMLRDTSIWRTTIAIELSDRLVSEICSQQLCRTVRFCMNCREAVGLAVS